MVQRKVPNKLGVQADSVKSEKRLGNLKPACYQNQDGKHRGPDMKKKMKRSRSIKLTDIESLKTSPLRKAVSQPGKPPPLHAQTTVATATPQKQPKIKSTDGSPNYMKATSSSEARKERCQVSSLNTQTGSDTKHRKRNTLNLELRSASANKQKRTSSLQLVRTLTKTPSFKPVRGTAKKCSGVALCTDVDVQKATCSSTLKDSKFPAYLMLNPGGTEAEGTSVIRVCPFTYCSLNGHHHTPSPPLKCFLKARRRALKTQKSMKLEALSPRRAKPCGSGTEGIDNTHREVDSFQSVKFPLMQEVGNDFFIDIYAKNTEDSTETTNKAIGENDVGTITFDGEHKERSFYGGNEVAVEQGDKEVKESLSNASPISEIDFEGNFEEYNNTNSEATGIPVDFPQEPNVDDLLADYSLILSQEEATMTSFDIRSDTEGEYAASVEDDDRPSEATDMEWEEGHFSASEVDPAADYPNKLDDAHLWEIKKLDFDDEPEILRAYDIISNHAEEILADDVMRELFQEETNSFDMQHGESNSEMDDTPQNWKTFEQNRVDTCLSYDQLSYNEGTFKEKVVAEEKGKVAETGLINGMITLASTEETAVESTESVESRETDNCASDTNPQLGDAENHCTSDKMVNVLDSYQENREIEQDGDYKNGEKLKDTQTDQATAINLSSVAQEFCNGEAGDPTQDQEQFIDAELSFGILISDSSQDFSEPDPDDTKANDNQDCIIAEACQIYEAAEDGNSSQDLVHVSSHMDGQCTSKNDVEKQNLLEEDQNAANKFRNLASVDLDDQSDSTKHNISSPEINIGEVEKMEVEACSKSDAAETFVMANNESIPVAEPTFKCAGRNSNQEFPSACSKNKWAIRCKRPIEDKEEQRKFNPREPNFLPEVPDPEAEKVDLRHQEMDERKNAEEWMLDYALQQAVHKLAPARKRKVALLVEAFETVLPIPKIKPHMRHTAAFSHTRPIQACS